MVQDGLRLPMSIWVACQQIKPVATHSPHRAEWLTHATELQTLDSTIERELSTGTKQIEIAQTAMVELERSLGPGK